MLDSSATVADLRRWILDRISPGDSPPDWVTIRRWKEKLGTSLSEEAILEMLELHYGKDFGAKRKLILFSEIVRETGQSEYFVRKKTKGMLVRIGSRLYLDRKDYEQIFG